MCSQYVDEGLAGGPFALRDLVLVVRELQVHAAAVDVEMLAEHRAAHRRAFDVPARPAGTVRTGPFGVVRLVGLGRLPQHEVQRIMLAVEHRHALSGAQFVERLARQLAVAGKLAHREVHVAIVGAVGQPLAFERANQVQHLRHVVGGTRLVRRRQDAQQADVLVHRVDHLVGELADGDAALQRTLDDLVFDVGDVAHIGHLVAQLQQPTVDHVEGHHHARMAHVAQVVDGHAADIHAHLARHDGLEDFGATGQRVVDAQGHGC